jgi:hypothetical protein
VSWSRFVIVALCGVAFAVVSTSALSPEAIRMLLGKGHEIEGVYKAPLGTVEEQKSLPLKTELIVQKMHVVRQLTRPTQ